jgi:transcriptional regulator with XRE-family HTH domain
MEIKLKLSEVIQNELQRRNLSITKLSSETGIPRSLLHDWIQSNISPTLNNKNIKYIEKLSDYFGVSIVKLIFGNIDEKSKATTLFSSTFKDGRNSYRLTVEKITE